MECAQEGKSTDSLLRPRRYLIWIGEVCKTDGGMDLLSLLIDIVRSYTDGSTSKK